MTKGSNICGLLNLTVRCNQNCLFCCDGEVKDSGYHPTVAEAEQKIDRIAQTGADSITFIGGEPLVRRELVHLVRHARERGLRVGLTSNGTLLTKERLAALEEAGLTSMELSIHTFDAERADAFARGRKTAARQLRALELLRESGRLGVSINFVLFAGNFAELPDFVRRVGREFGFIDELFINFLDPIGYPAHDHSLLPRYAQVHPYLREGLDRAHAAGLSFTVDSVPGCILGPYFLYLRATKEKLRGVRYAKSTLRIRSEAPDPDLSQYYRVNACFDCPVSGLCPGVNFRYLEIMGQGEFSPFPHELTRTGAFVAPPGLPDDLPARLAQGVAANEAARREPFPVAITSRCNNRCAVCACRTRGADPSPAALTRRLEQALAQDSPILLTGGEPALHPRFFKLLRLLAKQGRRVGFVTNGRLFSYSQWARKAAQAGAAFVVVRLPAPLDSLAAVTGDPDSPAQTREGLANLLRERRFHVRADVEVPPGTQAHLAATLPELKGMGVPVSVDD